MVESFVKFGVEGMLTVGLGGMIWYQRRVFTDILDMIKEDRKEMQSLRVDHEKLKTEHDIYKQDCAGRHHNEWSAI